MAKIFVLDSFAIMAYLEKEPGYERIHAVLTGAKANKKANKIEVMISLINWGEVLYILEREQGLIVAQNAVSVLADLPLTVVPVDRKLTLAAAHIKANYPISYADSFALALAQLENATLLTGDPEFQKVSHLATIEWLPHKP